MRSDSPSPEWYEPPDEDEDEDEDDEEYPNLSAQLRLARDEEED